MELSSYRVVPNDPRAPSQDLWDRPSEAGRRHIVEQLSSEFPSAEPPGGDRHRKAKAGAFEALDEYYRRIRRRIYLSSELPVYYPDEPVFAPDLIAVRDVEEQEASRAEQQASRAERSAAHLRELGVDPDDLQ